MDKAIEYLKNRRNRIIYEDEKLNEAIAELQAHKAKIESLSEYCRKQITRHKSYYGREDIVDAYQDILQKLEELDK